jgi:amidohydrolase
MSTPTPDERDFMLTAMAAWAGEVRTIRRDIHSHPELGFEEQRTATLVADRLRAWGIPVEEGIGKTGVVGVISAGSSDRAIGLRADMDALPIYESSGLPHASVHKGIAHSCGHDGHTSMLLWAARYLAETRRFNGRVHLIFQPAEEGQAGAKAMIDDGLFERFPCAEVYAIHNWPSLPAGTVAVRPGPMMAAADRFDIVVRGSGGHAALPQLGSDSILCAAQIVTGANTLVARRIDPTAVAVLSVTCIHGGDAHNVMPSEVKITGTVRTFDPVIQDRIEAALGELVDGTAKAGGCTAEMKYVRYYPATINNAECAQHVLDASRALFGQALVPEAPAATSEDFAFMLQKVPGAYVWLGQGSDTHPYSLHHPRYDFNDDILPRGAALLATLAQRRLAL